MTLSDIEGYTAGIFLNPIPQKIQNKLADTLRI